MLNTHRSKHKKTLSTLFVHSVFVLLIASTPISQAQEIKPPSIIASYCDTPADENNVYLCYERLDSGDQFSYFKVWESKAGEDICYDHYPTYNGTSFPCPDLKSL